MNEHVIIAAIGKLPIQERAKVFAWFDRRLAAREDELDRKAAAENRARIKSGEKTRPFDAACRELGLIAKTKSRRDGRK